MQQKRVFKIILAGLAILLAFLPFFVSINEILTKAIEHTSLYLWIQKQIVPWEVKMVGVMLKPLGINYMAHEDGFTANGTYAHLSWNCIGWQSLLLFLISLPFGLWAGNYTLLSKIAAIAIGILGTFWINLIRICITVIILVVSRPLFAMVFHDYLAAFFTVIWLIVFWKFAYGFVLEEMEGRTDD